MKYFQIMNPKAGHGNALNADINRENIIKYTTKSVGDAERYVKECCETYEGELRFIVCGGDGTINEVVNGIMSADAADRAAFSIMPTGSGNDFVRAFKDSKGEHRIDLLKYNGRYAANMINIGFDCNVVEKTSHYKNKKLISGSTAYILGVVNVLCHKLGKNFSITVKDKDGLTKKYDHPCLLTAIGNLPYCGGGFRALPLARADDSLIDLLIVSKVSRTKFISLVGSYRKGSYIDAQTKQLIPKFKNVVKYIQCKEVTIKGITNLCADGEVEDAKEVKIEIVPKAITYIN